MVYADNRKIYTVCQCGKRDFGRQRCHSKVSIVNSLQSYHIHTLHGVIYLRNYYHCYHIMMWYSVVPLPSSALMHEGYNPSVLNSLLRLVFAAFSWISSFVSSALPLLFLWCFFHSRDVCDLHKCCSNCSNNHLYLINSNWIAVRFTDELFSEVHIRFIHSLWSMETDQCRTDWKYVSCES